MSGAGTPLDARTRALAETRLGADFSRVRIHADEGAAQSARALSAHAYTVGNSIVFGRGRYAPRGAEGFRLLVHELVHTIQQGGSGPSPGGQRANAESPASPAEDEARAISAAVAGSAPPLRGRAIGQQVPAGSVQRSFVSAATTGARAVVKPDDIMAMLDEDDQAELLSLIGQRLGGPQAAEELVPYALKKLAEGPDIVYDGTKDNLLQEIEKRLSAIAPVGQVDEPAARRRRRLNRLAGQLESKLQRLRMTNTAAAKLAGVFGEVVQLSSVTAGGFDRGKALLEKCAECLSTFKGLLADDSRSMWAGYDAVSTFGPLGHAIVTDFPDLLPLHQKNLTELRNIRQLMARRTGVTVVAHRGSGPTNRTMGGLIAQDDQRRLNRPAENSPEAFDAALREVTSPSASRAGLDGIECDVYLSRDRVPIVSHEGMVMEQLNTVMQQATKAKFKQQQVLQFNAADITKIQRTANPESRFMTLAELLARVRPYADLYYQATGYPLRVEIEMKGTDRDKEFKPKPGEAPLTEAVGKVISQEIKQGGGHAVDYVLFNGTPADIPKFSELRTTKSALGGLYTGIGPKEKDPAKFDPLAIDELRYQFNNVLNPQQRLPGRAGEGANKEPDEEKAETLRKLLDAFIVTLVYSHEFAPLSHPDYASLKNLEPSLELEKITSDAVAKALTRRANKEPDIEDVIEEWLKWYLQSGRPAARLHILTDYPAKASYLKQVLDSVRGGGK